jgi:Leucine-rich repeat (LRR) protein
VEREVKLDEYIRRIEQNDQALCVIDLRTVGLNDDDVEILMAKLTSTINVAARITGLYLNDNQLTSINIPAELTNLKELRLYNNQLTSINIPAELINLKELHLNDNQLTSINIPAELTKLTRLHLGNNQLTSINIPVQLVNLRELWLGCNQLTSINIPVQLVNLRELWLGCNQLTSINIPAELIKLNKLYIDNNQLISINIQAEFTNLHLLYIGNNRLTMVTKIALGLLMATKQKLVIYGLDGDMIEQLSLEIIEKHFDVILNESLSKIKITFGSCAMKAAIKAITKLPKDLILSIINFINCPSKLLNENIAMLSGLFAKNESQLDILNEFLDSPLMTMIRNAIYDANNNEIDKYIKIYSLISRIEQNDQDLCVIDLEYTNLNNNDVEILMAKLTSTINVAARITKLYLNDNQLTSINIPAELINLKKLRIYNNQLTSINIPSELTKLSALSLSDNRLTSINIPAELTNIETLCIYNNQLTSINIPSELINLNALSLVNNRITSINIPAELTNLNMIYIGNNLLTSISIPVELINLKELYIGNNKLTSINIPVELTKLEELSLQCNQLTSINIPAELINLKKLYLDNNQLTSINIPGKFTNLNMIYIGNNQLTMVTKIALASLRAAEQNMFIHGLGNNIMEQLSAETLEEHFETIVNESLFEIKITLSLCVMKAAIEAVARLPENLIYSVINFINWPGKLLNENITMLRGAFVKNESQLNILNAFLYSPKMKAMMSYIYIAHDNEISRYFNKYILNSKEILYMRSIARKRGSVASGIATLTCKPNLKEECMDCTKIDLKLNNFQLAMQAKM